jgi:NADH pyrophosphatase NudC (nudix superfamily)
MEREKLAEKLQQEMAAIAAKLAQEASSSRQDMAAMERKIYAACDGLKAKILQEWVDAAVDDTAVPRCPHCGGPMRNKGHADKTSACMGGQVTVDRTRWWCDACKASFFPSGRDDDGGRPGDHSPGSP